MSLDIVLPMSLDRFVTYVPERFIRSTSHSIVRRLISIATACSVNEQRELAFSASRPT
jgi:hypothetical protein